MWDRCNDNIDFGMKFSRAFLDAREVVNDARALLNKHNNEAGRRVSQLCFPLCSVVPLLSAIDRLPVLQKSLDRATFLYERFN